MDDLYEKLITEPFLGLLLVEGLTAHQIELVSAIFEVRQVEVDGVQRYVKPCIYWEYDEDAEGVAEVEMLEWDVRYEEIK